MQKSHYERFYAIAITFAMLCAPAQAQESYLSSGEMTWVWSFAGLEILETGGSVNGPTTYEGKWKVAEFSTSPQITVELYETTKTNLDVQRIAQLVQSAFDTVSDIAGRPPVDKIELYLVPSEYSFSVAHRSWSFRGRHTVAYAIREDASSFEHTTVRDVSHELFHAWVGTRSSSPLNNEMGAATIENCAEMRALGAALLLDKSVVKASNFSQLSATSHPLSTSMEARYQSDPALDDLFINGQVRASDANAGKLEALCRARARKALANQ